jgi:hypothetical protein
MKKALAYFTFPFPDLSGTDLEAIGSLIADALKTGNAESRCVKLLSEEHGLSPEDATTVAHALIAYAYSVPSSDGTDVQSEKYEWLAGCCSICDANEHQIRNLGEKFPSGHPHPPACSYCVCSLAPVVEW